VVGYWYWEAEVAARAKRKQALERRL